MENSTEIITNWGPALAILGAALAAGLGGIGSAIGTQHVAKAGAGVVAEKLELSGKFIVLSALPSSQAIYGLVVAFMVINNFDVASLTQVQGFQVFAACLPLALTALFSGISQGKVAAAGANIVAKHPDKLGNAIIFAVLVETFAIIGLLITLLLFLNIQESIGA